MDHNHHYYKLLAAILHIAGSAGVKGFAYLVKWEVAYATTSLVTDIIALAVLVTVGIFLWKHKIKKPESETPRYYGQDDFGFSKDFWRLAAVAVCLIVSLCVLCWGIAPAVQTLITPQGAAVCEMLPGCSPSSGN